MPKQNHDLGRRLHLQIQEKYCPGLIAFLDRVPNGEVNAFIRNVLLHWFEVHEGRGDLEQAIEKMLLFGTLRIAREHLDVENNMVDTYFERISPTSRPQPFSVQSTSPITTPAQATQHSPNPPSSEPAVSSFVRPVALENTRATTRNEVISSVEKDAILFDPDDLLNGSL
ncbi:hypothetical protein [Noviherbaspirillum pedocola]|uniref:Uncharacterized protein n=1 Tax=Noviherbaspirillum pedocola TaxID=2801341 RepID=A0A934W791_9BURK|nr:hypothetical protein [Noviherbaspirillum pedocola]MBK4736090.1 hypothetical protein [Noviherbaspirillum pedocola]